MKTPLPDVTNIFTTLLKMYDSAAGPGYEAAELGLCNRAWMAGPNKQHPKPSLEETSADGQSNYPGVYHTTLSYYGPVL